MQLYELYEMNHAALSPFRAFADATRMLASNPLNPFTNTTMGRTIYAACELFERTTRRYGKPSFDLHATTVEGKLHYIDERVVWEKPFCKLINFKKKNLAKTVQQPNVLIVAPMSGHYATLLRGTVEAFLPDHNVYISDWVDARTVNVAEGRFDLDDYIDYVEEMIRAIGPNTHVVAVCQPSVPVMAAVSLMNANDDPCVPASMTLMGGPIDTRKNPTAVNKLAQEKGLEWFKRNVIMKVPFPNSGFMRDVYPGFLQLSGFMSMNMERHVNAHKDFFKHLVKGDGDSAEKHREFYDEYLAVMDLPAEFYLQTIETVFIKYALPKGEMMHRDEHVDPSKISKTALFTVEGENDDITGPGQSESAQLLCSGLPADMKQHYTQLGVGHYGVFNGSKFRAEIYPQIRNFIAHHREAGLRNGKLRKTKAKHLSIVAA